MNSQKSFTVKNPPLIFWLCICILGFFVILVSVYTIFSSSPHTGLYVCTAILVFIPGTIITPVSYTHLITTVWGVGYKIEK